MNNTMPKVSVIMPSYNTAALIGEALESVFAQSYRDFEVIVINDGSPDTRTWSASSSPIEGA
ncbi:MAG TPA: glycosyltransferase, partial [Candidatus Acidoferrum sp.]|nr:glycosyltransferase [Candidatus Acidoferrum sp.]